MSWSHPLPSLATLLFWVTSPSKVIRHVVDTIQRTSRSKQAISVQASVKKGCLSLAPSLRTLWSSVSSPKSNVAERSKRHGGFFSYTPVFFSNAYTFSSALHMCMSHVHAAGKGFPYAPRVGSTLHFQMEIGQNNVESRGGESAAWRRLSPCKDQECCPQMLCISGWEAGELQWITTFTGRCQLS